MLELRRFLADRGDLAFSLALPIALFALMYGVFSGEGSFNGTANVVDIDGGVHAEAVVSGLESVPGMRVRLYSEDEADRALDRTSILTAIVIPAGFSDALDNSEQADLVFKVRGTGGDEGQIVMAITRGVVSDVAAEVQARRTTAAALAELGVPASEIPAQVDAAMAAWRTSPQVATASETVGGSDRFVDRLLPGILVMFLMFAVALNAQTLVEDRRIGTLERLLTTRLSLGQLFMGKFLSGIARAMAQAVILLTLAFIVLRMAGAGSFFQALVVALLVAAAVSAIGLVIAAVARTRDQAAWIAVVVTMFMTIFGGTFFPVGSGALDYLSRATFSRYAIDAMEGVISRGESLGAFGVELAVLAGVTVVGLVVARALFKATGETR